ncbi:hypothetical protein GSUET_34470 [Geobacter sulfurreducens subsp. ethanolicus]|nr:hypothetical protein GSUET_34470 [Geobacter sulfurreducens subsp. ethanolicus]
MTESADNDVKNIIGAMSVSAADYAKIQKHGDLDVTNELLDAIDIFRTAKRSGNSIDDQLDQSGFDMQGNMTTVDPTTEALSRGIHEFKGSRKKLTALFKIITQKAAEEIDGRENDATYGATDMFGNSREKKDKKAIVSESVAQARRGEQADAGQDDLFRASSYPAGLYLLRKSTRRGHGNEGRETEGKAQDGAGCHRAGAGNEGRLAKAEEGKEKAGRPNGDGKAGEGPRRGTGAVGPHLLRKSNPNHGEHGHFASLPSHSIDPQPMDASMLLPKCQNPDDKAEQKRYINLFMAEFGGSIDKPVTFTDVTGKKLRISSRMFKDRKTGKYKIFKNGRERYLLMLASALKNPTEIWEDTATRRGNATPIRRYVTTYRIGSEQISGVIVFDLLAGQWEGTTAHQRKSIDAVRTGTLVYSAMKKAACFANPVARYPDCAMRMPGRASGLTKTLSDQQDCVNKSESLSADIKPAPQRDATPMLLKAHVAAYDRTTASGALAHVRAHEDSRVKKYGRLLANVRTHADLHEIRQARFGHLPNWGNLSEHDRNQILDAEDSVHRRLKEDDEVRDFARAKERERQKEAMRSGKQVAIRPKRAGRFLG